MNYNINDFNISNEIDSLRNAYSILQEAYLSNDRSRINSAYNYVTGLPIIGLRQRIQFETQKIFQAISNTELYPVAVDMLPPHQLEFNIRGKLL